SFLIASPLVNEVAVGLLWGMFGWRVAAMYVGAGLTIAIAAGWALGRMRAERWVEPFVLAPSLLAQPALGAPRLDARRRVQLGLAEVATIVRRIWPYLLGGVALGAAIHGWVPADFFARVAGAGNPF